MLELTYLGTFWQTSGDLFFMTDWDGNQARVFVDSIGETWVDIRRVPKGGFFHSERVGSYRALNGAKHAEEVLRATGFVERRNAACSHLVRERTI